MIAEMKKSRVGFVVVKLSAFGKSFFLLRRNDKWNDINFLGGHEKVRDNRSLHKTAERELWEEVPSIRAVKNFHLEPLTDELIYGPVFSRSQVKNVEYDVQFFLLKFENSPKEMIEHLGVRSRNIFVPEEQLLAQKGFRVSGLVAFLNTKFPGGLTSIPLSSRTDIGPLLQARLRDSDESQVEVVAGVVIRFAIITPPPRRASSACRGRRRLWHRNSLRRHRRQLEHAAVFGCFGNIAAL